MLLWSFDFKINYGKENRYWTKININSVIEIFFKIQEELSQMGELILIEGQWKLPWSWYLRWILMNVLNLNGKRRENTGLNNSEANVGRH